MSGTASAEMTAAPVSVQLTPIVPVRVFDAHGEYFDTEMDVDAPLRSLQLAIEDYFKIKPEVQLLLHNRQQVYADRSLRDNGCLLLKGDPYVKIVCILKRGPVLNLQCEVGPITYVIACHETATVWEVKKMLCEAMERQQRRASPDGAATYRLACGPERLRLLWRYMELNDKAELHYYRVPTNAVLHVMHRRRAVASAAASVRRPVRREAEPNHRSAPLAPPSTVWWQRPPELAPPPAAPAGPPAPPEAPAHSPADDRETRNAAVPSHTPSSAAAMAPPPPLVFPHYPGSQTVPTYASLSVPVPAASITAPLQPRSDPLTSSELVSLSLAVRTLEAQLQAVRQEQQQVEQFQRSLSAYQQGSFSDAQQRIVELEETVMRFHALLQRAVNLIPAA